MGHSVVNIERGDGGRRCRAHDSGTFSALAAGSKEEVGVIVGVLMCIVRPNIKGQAQATDRGGGSHEQEGTYNNKQWQITSK